MLAGILASLLLHALFLLLPGWRDSSPKPLNGLEIALWPTAPTAPPEAPEPLPEPQPEAEPEQQAEEPERPAEPGPETAAAESPDPGEPAQPGPEATVSGIQLRERVLARIALNEGEMETKGQRNALEPATQSRLPDSPGWLNDYVGSVQPQVDRWQGNDGSRHTRIVMSNGYIICGRADPPTSAEIFNPSLAMNIMRFANCGRERPTPVDRSDPWLRAPGE